MARVNSDAAQVWLLRIKMPGKEPIFDSDRFKRQLDWIHGETQQASTPLEYARAYLLYPWAVILNGVVVLSNIIHGTEPTDTDSSKDDHSQQENI